MEKTNASILIENPGCYTMCFRNKNDNIIDREKF